jgi:hypothetical protein
MAELLVDDISITNSTADEFVENGDFEGSAAWNYPNQNAGFITTTDVYSTDGIKSANLTAANTMGATYSYASIEDWYNYPRGFYPSNPGECVVEFDWMYTDTTNGGSSQQSSFYIYFDNESGSGYSIAYRLGRGDDFFSGTNSTNNLYIQAPDFGTRGVWNHLAIDLYDIANAANLTDGIFYDFYFDTQTGSESNSTVTLFVDDYRMNCYPSGDPGFEGDWYWTTADPIIHWYDSGAGYPYINITTDSHSGNYAANLTTWNGPNPYAYRSMFVPLDESIYTDFWWRLDYLNGNPDTISYVRLTFEGGYNLYYFTALTSGSSYSNSSWDVYYFVEGFNQTGVWSNIVRNPVRDLNAALSPQNWNLTQIRIYADSASSSNISIIYDDLHFVQDTHAPAISDVTIETSNPMYYDSVLISADVTDLGLDYVQLHFNNGSDYAVSMNKVGDQYEGWITPTPYGTDVEFYITATDLISQVATDDNSGIFYTYTPGDDVNPTITINDPDTSDVIEGLVVFDIDVEDPGVGASGVSSVELWDGSTLLMTDISAPWGFNWNSRLVSNGTYNLGVRVFDNAGNSAMDNITVTVDNDVVGPVISSVIVNPENPTYDSEVQVTVGVTDSTAVENVTLYMRPNGGNWITIEMEQNGNLYTGIIWARPWGATIDFYIVAYDAFGISTTVGSSSDPMGYVVGDEINPVAGVSGPSSDGEITGIVQFILSASDTGSGIYDYSFEAATQFGTPVSISSDVVDTDDPFSQVVNFDTTTVENGDYVFTFTVADRAGNTFVFELDYTINNPVGLDAVGSALSDFMSKYGFFVGAASVVIALILIQILLRKRRGS